MMVDLPNTSEQVIEHYFEELGGRVEFDRMILYRGMPECQLKAQITGGIFGLFLSNARINNWRIMTTDAGFTTVDGDTFAADGLLLLYKTNRINRGHAKRHLRSTEQYLPNWVLEVEWLSQVYAERKGHRKIIERYFAEDVSGFGESRIEEAWLIGWPDELVFDFVPSNELVEAQSVDHVGNNRPYLAIYRRDAAANPVAIYEISPNHIIHIPHFSLLAGFPSIPTNMLCEE